MNLNFYEPMDVDIFEDSHTMNGELIITIIDHHRL